MAEGLPLPAAAAAGTASAAETPDADADTRALLASTHWQPRMENAGFERDDVRRGCCSPGSAGVGGGGGSSSSTVEMSEVPAAVAGTAAVTGTGSLSASPPPSPLHAIAPPQLAINGNGVLTCSEHCTSLHMQHQKYYREKGEPPAPESPWHHLKTIFLVGTLVFLALWVLVYTLLSQLSVL